MIVQSDCSRNYGPPPPSREPEQWTCDKCFSVTQKFVIGLFQFITHFSSLRSLYHSWLRSTFVMCAVQNIWETSLIECEWKIVNPGLLSFANPTSTCVTPTQKKCPTNKAILYSERQLVKLCQLRWLFCIFKLSHLHRGIVSIELQKQSPICWANTQQSTTSMNISSKECVNQSIGGKEQYKYTFMRILNDKMYRICFFLNNQNE